jgi:outer membrane immunogenic protein
MRYLIIAVGLFGLVSRAVAADYGLPTLRGSQSFVPAAPTMVDWGGFYMGGQIGVGDGHANFNGVNGRPFSGITVPNLLESQFGISQSGGTIGSADAFGMNFGGFVGYNSQWDDVVLGLEVNYSRSSAPITTQGGANSVPGVFTTTDGAQWTNLSVAANGTMNVTDMATFRTRAGFVMGSFLPYFMAGFALGRADITHTAIVSGTQTPLANPPAGFTYAVTDNRSGAVVHGWSAGGGVDFMLTPNMFVRGEIEYITLSSVNGVSTALTNGRVAAAVKF